jgi:5S rRNA maturation endonuclease (ribonuclease M5)
MGDLVDSFYDKLDKENFESSYDRALETVEYKTYNSMKNFNLLDDLDDLILKRFLIKISKCYVVPLKGLFDETFGYTFRSVKNKDFHVVIENKKYPLCFGLETLKDFKYNMPILLAEGVKDAMTLRKLYSYSLAYLTSAPYEKLMEYLKSITNRIIFFPDSDTAGRKFIYDKDLKEKYKNCNKYYVPFGKDLGEYWNKLDNKYLDWARIIIEREEIE